MSCCVFYRMPGLRGIQLRLPSARRLMGTSKWQTLRARQRLSRRYIARSSIGLHVGTCPLPAEPHTLAAPASVEQTAPLPAASQKLPALDGHTAAWRFVDI